MCLVTYAVDSHPTYKLCASFSSCAHLPPPIKLTRGPSAASLPSARARSILASNRDEYLHRPTEPVRGRSASDLSKPGKEVYCGLDAVAGGTWLGLTREGRVGVLCVPSPPASLVSDGRLTIRPPTRPTCSGPTSPNLHRPRRRSRRAGRSSRTSSPRQRQQQQHPQRRRRGRPRPLKCRRRCRR